MTPIAAVTLPIDYHTHVSNVNHIHCFVSKSNKCSWRWFCIYCIIIFNLIFLSILGMSKLFYTVMLHYSSLSWLNKLSLELILQQSFFTASFLLALWHTSGAVFLYIIQLNLLQLIEMREVWGGPSYTFV